MSKKVLLLLAVLLIGMTGTNRAQIAPIPRDTSFTISGTYQKEIQKFPFIRIADRPAVAGVTVDSNVVYSLIGHRALHLDVFSPPPGNQAAYPVVLLIHGGGWRSGDRTQTYAIARQLVSRGFVAVAVEYRLSLEAKFPAAIIDMKAAIRFMRGRFREYKIDKDRVAVMGFSSGGQMAALLGTLDTRKYDVGGKYLRESSRVQAVIDVDGILAFKHPESAEGAVAAQWLGGTYEERPSTWTEASALTHAGAKSASFLFINSSLPRFHAGRDDLIRKLDAAGIYSEVHTFPDTPHPFWFFDPWFEPTVDWTVGFLGRNSDKTDRK